MRPVFGMAVLGCALALSAAPAAMAEEEGPSCAAFPGWTPRETMRATPAAYDLAVTRLNIGRAVDAELRPLAEVEFVAEPERAPELGDYAGLFGFTVTIPGTYLVVLGHGAWIDVVDGDALVPSVSFGQRRECEGMGKGVSFPLEAGNYVLQLSAAGQRSFPVMVARTP